MEHSMFIYLKPQKRPFSPQRFAAFIALIFPIICYFFLYISIVKIPKPGFF